PLSGIDSISFPIRIAANQSFVVSNGAVLNLTTNVDTNGRELILAPDGELRVTGVISGAGSLVKSGSGLAVLSRANTYSGTADVQAGTLEIGNGAALGGTAAETTVRS